MIDAMTNETADDVEKFPQKSRIRYVKCMCRRFKYVLGKREDTREGILMRKVVQKKGDDTIIGVRKYKGMI